MPTPTNETVAPIDVTLLDSDVSTISWQWVPWIDIGPNSWAAYAAGQEKIVLYRVLTTDRQHYHFRVVIQGHDYQLYTTNERVAMFRAVMLADRILYGVR